jgi:hypothetical protein
MLANSKKWHCFFDKIKKTERRDSAKARLAWLRRHSQDSAVDGPLFRPPLQPPVHRPQLQSTHCADPDTRAPHTHFFLVAFAAAAFVVVVAVSVLTSVVTGAGFGRAASSMARTRAAAVPGARSHISPVNALAALLMRPLAMGNSRGKAAPASSE